MNYLNHIMNVWYLYLISKVTMRTSRTFSSSSCNNHNKIKLELTDGNNE